MPRSGPDGTVNDGLAAIELIRAQIRAHPSNAPWESAGHLPLFTAHPLARIVVIGQAPGVRAQDSGLPWNDASGDTLMRWLGVSPQQFRDDTVFAMMPMDFYYPGRGASGDLPPRADFASRWHPPLVELMPHVRLTLLIGRYAQRHYLPDARQRTLTETVRAFGEYLPQVFPLVHPSPLNFRWQARNPWFEDQAVPELQARVAQALAD
ncbi:uracil-DNA glycosylase family protein [Demequina sp.]|uniref:uracil-DNA glycosylase family protein n=1 Tax=Demequina sp. TaxID=2050685 RepID=UPI003A86C95B